MKVDFKDSYSLKKIVFGTNEESGMLKKAIIYFVLIGIGFVYIYPFLHMLINSFKDLNDLVDPAVTWVPTKFYLQNYKVAYKTLDATQTLTFTIALAGGCAILQTMCSALAGYGLARFEFMGKKVWMFLLLVSFLIPVQVTVIPRYLLFDQYKLIGSPLSVVLPSIFGQGIKGALFVFIFYQFFHSYPKALDEAAEIDGAGKAKIFFRIALPMAMPAIIVSLIFSFVWNWNETYMASLLFGKTMQTLPMKLSAFVSLYQNEFGGGDELNKVNEGIRLAGTMITILPLIITYTILQKQFVESVDRSGITGE
ncbi:MAG: carbohydrate ABC transporter permease [Cellulosilyticaceae bacterium]